MNEIVLKLSNDNVICTAAAPQRSLTNGALELATYLIRASLRANERDGTSGRVGNT
jgi:hypothetical protein